MKRTPWHTLLGQSIALLFWRMRTAIASWLRKKPDIDAMNKSLEDDAW